MTKTLTTLDNLIKFTTCTLSISFRRVCHFSTWFLHVYTIMKETRGTYDLIRESADQERLKSMMIIII